ncbi:MAG: tRNA dihydrouridine(20/20a) synthase DusA [Halomonadaceae bacterium]|nr:MAG: tRNA dihydrouridine(20/20a) synthase DusA [Halomonadaceae bacterium]
MTEPALPHSPDRRFCIAPMMDWTTQDYRYFARGLTRHALLYTEMVTTGALIHGDTPRFLRYSPQEQPLALQLGGSDPGELAHCAALAQDYGFAEVNLNVGCPSDRVQNNLMGACLMAYPEKVAEAVRAMKQACDIPVTVKHRIGINGRDSYAQLQDFVATVAQAGCQQFIVHGRIAILQGLSPKENRDIPPLNYPRVYQLKQDFPELEIIINGGLKTLTDCQQQLAHVDGVMVGREAYQRPWMLAEVDALFYPELPGHEVPLTRHQAVERLLPYIEQRMSQEGVRLSTITRHILGIFHGCPGGRQFRRLLSEQGHLPGAGPEVLERALARVPPVEEHCHSA